MCRQGSSRARVGRRIFGLVPIVLALAASVSAADARSRHPRQEVARDETAFDGPWSVLIQAESGPCAGSYRYGLQIVDGTVTYEGTPYGRVAPNGSVRVQLSLGDQHAEGVGRLTRGGGSGVWRGVGQSGSCTGRWWVHSISDPGR